MRYCTGRSPSNKTHGLSRTALYAVWVTMKERCLNGARGDYKRYGGRGIRVCDRWLHSFEAFLADMGDRPSPRHSLDRKDPNGHYEPSNCRWATAVEQARNRRANQTITHGGETLTVAEWSERTGIKAPRLYWRLHRGLPPEEILSTDDRRAPITLTHAGITLTLHEWASRLGVKSGTLWYRLRNGWPVERVLS
jgi:hypothetical protein